MILNGDSTFQASPAANGWTVSGSSVVTLGVRSAQVIVAAARAAGPSPDNIATALAVTVGSTGPGSNATDAASTMTAVSVSV
ncbi:hypothetical protein C6A85_10135, partial [Mycobacterium sp. ITM-2017-0098]